MMVMMLLLLRSRAGFLANTLSFLFLFSFSKHRCHELLILFCLAAKGLLFLGGDCTNRTARIHTFCFGLSFGQGLWLDCRIITLISSRRHFLSLGLPLLLPFIRHLFGASTFGNEPDFLRLIIPYFTIHISFASNRKGIEC